MRDIKLQRRAMITI